MAGLPACASCAVVSLSCLSGRQARPVAGWEPCPTRGRQFHPADDRPASGLQVRCHRTGRHHFRCAEKNFARSIYARGAIQNPAARWRQPESTRSREAEHPAAPHRCSRLIPQVTRRRAGVGAVDLGSQIGGWVWKIRPRRQVIRLLINLSSTNFASSCKRRSRRTRIFSSIGGG